MDQTLKSQVLAASLRPPVLSALSQIYTDLSQEISLRKPLCIQSGKCCRFDEYGHRLYVTTIELASFLHQLSTLHPPQTQTPPTSLAQYNSLPQLTPKPDPSSCPFQQNKLCTVHTIRPFGCRIFFCDPTSTDWQYQMYERFQTTLKQLHTDLSVPYTYIDWRSALKQLDIPTP
jgi:Fe-S-cluster containining protein